MNFIMFNPKSLKKAFSLIELSIVILIIGILVAGVTQSSRLIQEYKLAVARKLNEQSPLTTIPDLFLWFDTTPANLLANTDSSTDISGGDIIDNVTESVPNSTIKNSKIICDNTNSSNLPQYQFGSLNGLPALRFDATNLASSRLTCNLGTTLSLNNTIFIVFNFKATNGPSYTSYLLNISSTHPATYFTISPNGSLSVSTYPGPTDILSSATILTGRNIIMSRVSNTSSNYSELFINGASAGTSTASITGNYGANHIVIGNGGGGRPFGGDIGEVIIFDRVLKTSERQAIEEYLSQKWGIAIN